MQIDWFTVIAQVINFFILVWLLKKFLYKPVLDAIDERERKIAAELADAAAKEQEAQKEKEDFFQKNATFNNERVMKMDKVVAEADVYKQKLLEDARNESAILRAKLAESLKSSQQNIAGFIVQKTKEEVFAIASKTFTDLASVSLEEQVVAVAIKKLATLGGADKEQLCAAFKTAGTTRIKSAFTLSGDLRNNLQKAINTVTGGNTAYVYETDTELISGIEISGGSYKMGWNITSYLNELEHGIQTILLSKTN